MSLNQLSQVSTIILALIVGTYSLQVTQAILLPLVLALMIYALALPLVDYLVDRWKFSRLMALLCSSAIYFSSLFIVVVLSFVSIRNFSRDAKIYKVRILESANVVQSFLSRLGVEIQFDDLYSQIDRSSLLDWGHLLTGNLLNLVSYFAMTSIYLIFLFLGKSKLSDFPPTVIEIQSGVARYVWVKSLLSFLTAALVGIVLLIFDVEMSMLFILLTFALNFIPSLGSILATLLPMPVIWLQFGLGPQFWIFLGASGLIQFYIGNILEPNMLGKQLNLHPVTVMFFLVFWGFVWGISGAFLSIPLTMIMKLFLNKIPAGKPFADLMEGRLPVSP